MVVGRCFAIRGRGLDVSAPGYGREFRFYCVGILVQGVNSNKSGTGKGGAKVRELVMAGGEGGGG